MSYVEGGREGEKFMRDSGKEFTGERKIDLKGNRWGDDGSDGGVESKRRSAQVTQRLISD